MELHCLAAEQSTPGKDVHIVDKSRQVTGKGVADWSTLSHGRRKTHSWCIKVQFLLSQQIDCSSL